MQPKVIPLHYRAVASPSPTAQELATLKAQQEAENALSMALYHLRAKTCNVPGATRKAVQALAALAFLRDLVPADGQIQSQRGTR